MLAASSSPNRHCSFTSALAIGGALALVSCSSSSGDASATSNGAAGTAGSGATSAQGGASAQGGGGAGGGSAVGGSVGAAVRATKRTTCTYDIRPRPEYVDVYDPATTGTTEGEVVSAAPQISRLRLGLGGRIDPAAQDRADPSTSIAVGWETDLATTATTLAWGTTPDPSTWAATDVVDGMSYTVKIVHEIDGGPVRMHEAHVCGLSPKTTYYYRVGGGPAGSEVWSEVRSFRTLSSSPDDEAVIALTGDSRGEHQNAWQLLEERLYKRGDIQLQLFSGDLTDIPISGTEYESWLQSAETGTDGKPTALSQILTLLAMGNHENYQTTFFATVIQPDDHKSYDGFGELFFSVDVGAAHIVVLDDFAIGNGFSSTAPLASAALAWLDQDLSAAQTNRAARPWIVVVHHHGEWTSGNHSDDPVDHGARARLTPIWDKYGVDLSIAGHDHNYERSKPLTMAADGSAKLGSGTSYVICAGSGADGYGITPSMVTASSFSFSDDGALGAYGILHVTKSKLSLEAHEMTAAGDDPVKDTLELTK